MNNQEIKTKPPKNATDIDIDGIYWLISSQDKPQAYLYDDWTYCDPRTSLRSLADIKRIVELEDLVEDIINAESADEKLRPMMYHVWLFKAKALKEPKAGRGFFIMKEDGQWEPKP